MTHSNEPVAVPVEPTDVGHRQGHEARVKQPEEMIVDSGMDHSSYEGTYGSPLVADYLGLRDLYKTDPTGSIKDMVKDLTQHLYDVTEQPMVFAMEDALERMEQELNLKKEDAGLYKLKKLHNLMTAKQRIQELERARAQAIDDINSMM